MSSSKPPSTTSAAPDLSILGDRITVHPPSVSSASPPPLPKDPSTTPEQPLLESYARFRSSPLDALREFGLHVSGTGWRSYDTIVGQEIFYNGFSDRMKGMVIGSPLLRAKITQLAEKRVEVEESEGTQWLPGDMADKSVAHSRQERQDQIEKQLKEVAEQWTDQMICKMESRRFIRGAYYLATQLLTRAYHQGMVYAHSSVWYGLIVVQASMSRAKRFCDCAKWPKKQPRRTSPSSSYHVIVLMSIMSRYSSFAIDLAWLCLQLSLVTISTFQSLAPFYSTLVCLSILLIRKPTADQAQARCGYEEALGTMLCTLLLCNLILTPSFKTDTISSALSVCNLHLVFLSQ